jgi:hypothetical protein
MAAYLAADRLDLVVRDTTELLNQYPHVAEFHLYRSAARMKLGQVVQGYQEFGKWAYKLHHLAGHPFHAYPRWKTHGITSETGLDASDSVVPVDQVHVWNAEGAGDYFQFIRFARAMAADGWRVRAICNKTMDRLIARVPGVESVISEDHDIPRRTVLAALPTLPAEYLGVARLWEEPYLSADAATAGLWRRRIQHCLSLREDGDFRGVTGNKLKIGLAWRGNPKQANDDRRSVPFERFAPLFGLPGIQLVSLQHRHSDSDHSPLITNRLRPNEERLQQDVGGEGATYTPTAGSPVLDLGEEYQRGDWLDTAGVIANLDLVIAPCTGVAHLAGAMGKPVWLALSEPGCWRWMQNRTESPWYPSMRIFRQRMRGAWDGVFEAMAAELATLTRAAA